LRELALREVGKCVRVHERFYLLVKRANMIYFRLCVSLSPIALFFHVFRLNYCVAALDPYSDPYFRTQPSQSLLLPALLSRFKKRCYASVASTRTRDIWPTREALLAYEEALRQEEIVDAVLAGDFAAVEMKREFKTPGADGLQFRTPVTPSTDPGVLKTPSSTKTVRVPASERKGRLRSESALKTSASVKIEKSDSVRVLGARIVKNILEEVYPHWEALVKVKCEDACAEKVKRYGLERFESGMNIFFIHQIYTIFNAYFRARLNSPYL